MRTMRNLVCSLLLLLPAAGGLYARQQPPEGAARLESNREYMALMEEDRALQVRQDSVAHAMEQRRAELRANPDARARLSDEILKLEMQIFELRSTRGRLVDRINELEQEWVLAQLENEPQQDADWSTEPASQLQLYSQGPIRRNLVENSYFRDNLPADDYRSLLEAQRLELQAVAMADRYLSNYETLSKLARAYEKESKEEVALETFDQFQTLQLENQQLADSLSAVWNYIFDNKSYAYGYVLDKLNHDRVLEVQERRLSEAMQQLAELRGQTASDALADYGLRKPVAVDYEMDVARMLGLDTARDSLMQERTRVRGWEFKRPKIAMKRRSFIDYEALGFSNTPRYSAQHPIPECRIYERGTIYRILLGRFSAKRPVSTFKGTFPLSCLLDADKKWNYYAGGFATLAEAEDAQKRLKEKGFLKPEIVVWTDGSPRNLSQLADEGALLYRVEIETETLSDELRAAIASAAADPEISKVGQKFVVGPLGDRETADAVAAAVREADDRLEIKVTETSQESK